MFKSLSKILEVQKGDSALDAIMRGAVRGLAVVGLMNMAIDALDIYRLRKRKG